MHSYPALLRFSPSSRQLSSWLKPPHLFYNFPVLCASKVPRTSQPAAAVSSPRKPGMLEQGPRAGTRATCTAENHTPSRAVQTILSAGAYRPASGESQPCPPPPPFQPHKDRHPPPPPGPTRSPHLARQPARPAGKEHSIPLKKISSRPPPLGPSYIRSLLAAAVFACRCPRFQNLRIASPWPSRMQVCDVSPARSSGTRLA